MMKALTKRRTRDLYIGVFDNPEGREVLKHLMRVGHVMDSTFVPGDPYTSALNEGSRRLVLSIIKTMNLDPEQLLRKMEAVYDDVAAEQTSQD